MKGNKTSLNTKTNIEEDSIDIISLLKKIWKQRRFIKKVLIVFFFVGCLVSLFSPVVYTSQTTFVPQVSDDQMQSTGNQLGSLASLAGINLKTNQVNSDSYLSPLLYTKIIDSEEFSLNLLSSELINSNGEKFSVKDYLLSKKISFNLSSKEKVNSDFLKNYNFISDQDYYLINSFRKNFTIELNEKEGFIKVLAMDKDPFISSQLAELITKSLQTKIIEIRTNKIKERLEFSKEQYEIKQSEFDLLQKKLAEFKDSNKNISTASFRSELQKLESEYQLQQNILLNLASEYNNNKIKLNKDTPIFSVIDEVSVPNEKSKPKRSILIFTSIILGLILSVGYILIKEPTINLIKEINN